MTVVSSGWRVGMSEAEAHLFEALRAPAFLRVFLPSRDHSVRPLAPRRIQTVVIRKLLKVAGGATTLSGIGSWISEDGQPVHEAVQIVECYLPGLDTGASRDLTGFLTTLASDTGQEALAVGVNGRLLLLRGQPGTSARAEFMHVAPGS